MVCVWMFVCMCVCMGVCACILASMCVGALSSDCPYPLCISTGGGEASSETCEISICIVLFSAASESMREILFFLCKARRERRSSVMFILLRSVG